MPYYAVARGRVPGVFTTWNDCEDQVKGFSGARYKKFNTEAEAMSFVVDNSNDDTTKGRHLNVKVSSTTASLASKNKCGTSSISIQKQIPAPTYSRQRQEARALGSASSFNLDGIADSVQINESLSKHMDILESRLECVKNNVNKIYERSAQVRGKRTLLIEPQDDRKRTRMDLSGTDEHGYAQVYTDGACRSNGRRGARAGYGVWWGDNHPMNECGPVARPTNNSGEIHAAVRACQLAKKSGLSKLCINTDSKFLINSITKWMRSWKRNNWKLKSGEPVKNMVDFQKLDSAMKGLAVKWQYVEAHRGVYGNEKADELARRGASGVS